MVTIKDGLIVFNVSDNKANYSQRNNQYKWFNSAYDNQLVFGKVTAATMCNVTSLCMALDYAGYKVPTEGDDKYPQPEDRLAKFIMESKDVDRFYKEKMPAMYADYKAGKKGCYTPNEIHAVLAYAVNQWLGTSADTFRTDISISEMKDIIINKTLPIVISGCFAGLNHIINLVGFAFAATPEAIKDCNNADYIPFVCGTYPVVNVIYDDPYGKTGEYDKNLSGNDVYVPYDKFISDVKPLGNAAMKWGHVLKTPAAII